MEPTYVVVLTEGCSTSSGDDDDDDDDEEEEDMVDEERTRPASLRRVKGKPASLRSWKRSFELLG